MQPIRDARVVVRWTMAVLLCGAAAVHFAAMGEHAGVSWTHGLFFATVAWVQVLLACWLVLRPSRQAVVATVLVNFGIVVVWLISRTFGIAIGTDGTPEVVAFRDAFCTALEALTIAGGLLLISDGVVKRRVHAAMGWGAVAGSALAVTALTSIGFTPALANSTGGGHSHGHSSKTALASALHVHTHNPDQQAELQPDKPLDAATRATLASQLVVARDAALTYPTVADAKAAGYIQAGRFAPGVGAHYVSMRGAIRAYQAGGFDPSAPESLIYDGTNPDSKIVGLMYTSLSGVVPEGFAGPNDHWHRHRNVCIKFTAGEIQVPFPADSDITPALCSGAGGRLMPITTWMVHAWVVPGWESPKGVFSHDNPNLLCADGTSKVDGTGFCQGT
jgi:hypothetical protein